MTPTLLSPAVATSTRLIVPDTRRPDVCIEFGAHDITIDGVRVRYDDITAIAYAATDGRANLVQRRHRRTVRMWTATGAVAVDLGRARLGPLHDDEQAHAYAFVIGALHDDVERRLRASLLAAVRRGERIGFGALDLDPEGAILRRGRRADVTWSWPDGPTAELEGDTVAIRAGRNEAVLGRIPAMVPNAVLLPELLLSAGALGR